MIERLWEWLGTWTRAGCVFLIAAVLAGLAFTVVFILGVLELIEVGP